MTPGSLCWEFLGHAGVTGLSAQLPLVLADSSGPVRTFFKEL